VTNPNQNQHTLQADGRVHGVVVACRREDGKWLCIRRSDKVLAPLKVCFPGGTIEIGESQPDAVVREMKEELDAAVRPIKHIWHWVNPDRNVTLWGWTAELLPGQIEANPNEVAEILWLSGDEVAEHPDALPSNRLFVKSLKNLQAD
jgi:8-oxo-dGTP diphosphatase